MTLHELINKSNYKTIFNLIYKWHLKSKIYEEVSAYDVKFLDAWTILRKIKLSKEQDFNIYLKHDEESGIDVCLFSIKENSFYALDFVAWDELINMEIVNKSSLSDKEVMASILWEITFWGFNPEQISNQAKVLEGK
tara:strand:- start:540 stop:950 length:411 start_codon:yes stop_codon:yes gene_type:complete